MNILFRIYRDNDRTMFQILEEENPEYGEFELSTGGRGYCSAESCPQLVLDDDEIFLRGSSRNFNFRPNDCCSRVEEATYLMYAYAIHYHHEFREVSPGTFLISP